MLIRGSFFYATGTLCGGNFNLRVRVKRSLLLRSPEIFMRKIKIALFLLAMLASAAGGAFVALKVAAGTDVGDMIVQRKIQDRVSEKISRIRATQGDILELAVLESVLTFEQEDDWKNVPAGLGKSVSRAEIPAVFRFFVKISEPISVSAEERDGEVICTVTAPKLRPVLPVAFDTSRIAWTRDIGILRFNREEMTDELQKKVSMRLVLSAKNHAKSPAVREAARKAFEKFVAEWVSDVRELRERPNTRLSVKVLFADEVPPPSETSGAETEPVVVPVSV